MFSYIKPRKEHQLLNKHTDSRGKKGKRTLATYSISANLKARPRQLKRKETRKQVSQKVFNRSSSSPVEPLFIPLSFFASSSKASAMADRGIVSEAGGGLNALFMFSLLTIVQNSPPQFVASLCS